MRQRVCARSLRRSETSNLRLKILQHSFKSERLSTDSSVPHLPFLSGFAPRRQTHIQPSSPELRATVAPEQNSSEVEASTPPSEQQQGNVFSLLGSIPSKVTVTVKNNVVSAKSLFSTARRMVRLPKGRAASAKRNQKEEVNRSSLQLASLVAPAEAPTRPTAPMVTVPAPRSPPMVTLPAPPAVERPPLIWPSQFQTGLHPSLQLVRDRYWSASTPGQRRDGFKLGLVVEGGGMRGIVSGAMLLQLQRLGLRDVFDAVYGASAGAINASYFLAGQTESVDIYTRYINNSEFINLARAFTSQPVMNLDLLVDVMNNERALDWDAVINSPIPLKVVASCLDSLGPVLLENFTDKEDLTQCLRASANVPQIVGPPCEVRGRRLVDAAVFEPVPYRAALKDGCTHLVVLCTRPRCRSSPFKRQLQHNLTSMLKRTVLNPTYMREAWRRELQMLTHNGMHLDDLLALALEGGENADLYRIHGGFMFPVYPGAAAGFAPITRDTATLERGLEEGLRAAQAIFGPLVNFDVQMNDAIRGAKVQRLSL